MRNFLVWLLTLVALALSGCGYKTFLAAEENVQVGWSEVLNQYQRRSDLVPELVNAVRGAAASEQDTLVAVTNALTAVMKIKATADLLNNPWAFVRFVEAQASYNATVRTFWGTANLLHYSVKPTFSAGEEKAIVVFPKVRREVTYESPEVTRWHGPKPTADTQTHEYHPLSPTGTGGHGGSVHLFVRAIRTWIALPNKGTSC